MLLVIQMRQYCIYSYPLPLGNLIPIPIVNGSVSSHPGPHLGILLREVRQNCRIHAPGHDVSVQSNSSADLPKRISALLPQCTPTRTRTLRVPEIEHPLALHVSQGSRQRSCSLFSYLRHSIILHDEHIAPSPLLREAYRVAVRQQTSAPVSPIFLSRAGTLRKPWPFPVTRQLQALYGTQPVQLFRLYDSLRP